MDNTKKTQNSKITYEKTGGVFGIYRLHEESDTLQVVESFQNGEKLIWFQSYCVRMFHALQDSQTVFAKRHARQNETEVKDNIEISDVTCDRRMNIELEPDCFFGAIGSREPFTQITLEVHCNTDDTKDDVCIVRPFSSDCFFILRLSSTHFNFVWEAIKANPLAAIRFGIQDGSIHHDDDPVGGHNPIIAKVLSREVAEGLKSSCESPSSIWAASEVSAEFKLLVISEYIAKPENGQGAAEIAQLSAESEQIESEKISKLLERIASFKSELVWLRSAVFLILVSSVISTLSLIS